MIEKRKCPVCDGKGRIILTEICTEECWNCSGKGIIELEILNNKSIRKICNQIQDILSNTDVYIYDSEIIEFLNNHKID